MGNWTNVQCALAQRLAKEAETFFFFTSIAVSKVVTRIVTVTDKQQNTSQINNDVHHRKRTKHKEQNLSLNICFVANIVGTMTQ